MVQKASNELEVNKPAYMYYLMTKSGHCSPTSDAALDSGTGSDLETTPTPNGNAHHTAIQSSLTNAVTKSMRKFGDLSLDIRNGHQHRVKLRSSNDSYNTDSEESESSLSCDSLNSSEIARLKNNSTTTTIIRTIPFGSSNSTNIKNHHQTDTMCLSPVEGTVYRSDENNITKINFLPHSLLRDIRDRPLMTATKVQSTHLNGNAAERSDDDSQYDDHSYRKTIAKNDSYDGDDCSKTSASYTNQPFNLHPNANGKSEFDALFGKAKKVNQISFSRNGLKSKYSQLPSETRKIYENDKYISFHLNECVKSNGNVSGFKDVKQSEAAADDDTFAGYKDVCVTNAPSTIRSSKGTIRGVKNRVRNGIATFLQMQQTNVKNYKEKDAGKVVLYSTSMGIVRETYAKCANVKQILRTLLIKFEERDIFMSSDYQQEIKDRMQTMEIQVPQLFVDGQYIGNADQVERLNESGELRQMLKIYKSSNTSYTCQICGGYRLLPCPSCSGSKKSVHRNHFTTEFVALKCMNCDEVGLVKCYNCN